MTAENRTPHAPFAAGHGVHRSDSAPAARSLAPDRRGSLKNGNRSGDFLAAPRCGARTRCGGECRQPAMRNGRCRLHGGLSTGPRTAAGLDRSRRARWQHGARSAQVRALLRDARIRLRSARALRARLAGSSAGHGVDRPKLPVPAGARGARPPSPTTAPSSSTSPVSNPRAHATRPDAERSNGVIAAGHGVHRSFRGRLCASASFSAIGVVLRSSHP